MAHKKKAHKSELVKKMDSHIKEEKKSDKKTIKQDEKMMKKMKGKC